MQLYRSTELIVFILLPEKLHCSVRLRSSLPAVGISFQLSQL